MAYDAQIHILDGQNDVILDIITAKNIIDDTHKKSLEDTLETYDFITFANKRFSQYLEKRNRIIIPDEDETLREFVIFEAAKYRDTEGYKAQVFSHASYLELKKARILYPTHREGLTASQHAGWALNDTGWTVGIVEAEGTRTFTIEKHTNPYEFLKRIANEFEVELRFRIEHDGNRITGRYVDLLERIGEWRGREIEFGKDLDGIRRVEKQDIVTALLGLGPEREDGSRIEVLVEDEEALQRWGRVDEHGNLHHLIEPYEIQSDRQEMTEEEARRYTRTALDKRINTQVTYETTILDLEEVPGLENKQIRFGDTIRIKDTYFNPPLFLEARVYDIERSIKNKAKKDIKLGDYVEYTEEEVDAIWNQLRNEIRRRLDRIAIVSINSSAGNVFKNAQGETELTARTFVNGAERDEDGTLYDYQWMRFDKDGNHDTNFYAEGKAITVKASDIDEKATYRVLVAYELEVINTAEITISNVFDGEDGEPGPPGPKGDKGDKGDPGPQGPPGTSVESIVEYYLATDQSSGVTTDTPGWTTTMQQMTPQKRYLWNYERINFSDGTHQNTSPVIIGVYGDEGEEGRSIVDTTEYYLATNASSGVTRSTSGWTTTMQVTTPEKKYLWNYEEITWNKAPTKTYTEPVIIGVHGEQGPKGEDGKTFYTWIKYADTPTSGMSDNPEGKEYIGIAYNKETPTPSTNYADYVWSKFKGEQGVPGPPGEDGQPTYTWVKYADDDKGSGMSDSPDGKLYIGLAFNKTTPEESNNPADYTWSLMPQNIEIGGRNLLRNSDFSSGLNYWQQFGQNTITLDENGYSGYGLRIVSVSTGTVVPRQPYYGSFSSGEKLTVSVKVKTHSGDFSKMSARFANSFSIPFNYKKQLNDDWELYVFTGTVPSDYNFSGTVFGFLNTLGEFTIDEVKLEKGNKATDWTPAPEDVQAEIDEAKQEAQQAKTTADGKNAVFTQSTAPPTTGRKIGDIWFDTSRDNLMHRFNGQQWVEAKWGEQSIVANSITANHIKSLVGLNVNDQFIVDSQGNVKFAGSLEGASGTFGEVTVTDGDFKLKKDGLEYSATPRRNLIKDHSFELVRFDGQSVDGTYVWADPIKGDIWYGDHWEFYGNPKLAIEHEPHNFRALPIFGKKAMVVRDAHFCRQQLWEGVAAEQTYTISAFFKRQWNVAGGRPRFEVDYMKHRDGNITRHRLINQIFDPVPSDYSVVRHSATFTIPSEFDFAHADYIEVKISGGDANWVQVDGVQLVEGDIASPYLDSDDVWEALIGDYKPRTNPLWEGAVYLMASHVIKPKKTLGECANGWVLAWSAYTPGTGPRESDYQYTFIPKVAMYSGSLREQFWRGGVNVWVHKYFYVDLDTISGHDSNGDGDNRYYALRGVYEF